MKKALQNRVEIPFSEPRNVKLYLDTWCCAASILPLRFRLFFELLRHMPQASAHQNIAIDEELREKLCKTLSVERGHLRYLLNSLIKTGFLIRRDKNAYNINPFLVGKGSWGNIRKLWADPLNPDLRPFGKAEGTNDNGR